MNYVSHFSLNDPIMPTDVLVRRNGAVSDYSPLHSVEFPLVDIVNKRLFKLEQELELKTSSKAVESQLEDIKQCQDDLRKIHNHLNNDLQTLYDLYSNANDIQFAISNILRNAQNRMKDHKAIL